MGKPNNIVLLYDREDRIADYDQSGNLITAYTHGPTSMHGENHRCLQRLQKTAVECALHVQKGKTEDERCWEIFKY